MVLPLFVWFALTGCSTLEAACVGLGFDDACSTAAGPTPGPWRAVAVFSEDACAADDGSWGEGWSVTDTEDGFELQWPVDASTACAVDGSDFTCEDAVASEGTLSLSGTLASASSGTATLAIAGAGCSSAAELELRAAWKDGLVPADGACPDNFGAYGPSERTEVAAFTVHNRTSASIGLYAIGDGEPVFIGDAEAGSSFTTSGTLDAYYVLGTGAEEAACGLFFRLSEDGQDIVWDGGA